VPRARTRGDSVARKTGRSGKLPKDQGAKEVEEKKWRKRAKQIRARNCGDRTTIRKRNNKGRGLERGGLHTKKKKKKKKEKKKKKRDEWVKAKRGGDFDEIEGGWVARRKQKIPLKKKEIVVSGSASPVGG